MNSRPTPRKPPRPCSWPGCSALVSRRAPYCEPHLAEHRRRQDANRGTTAERGYGAAHRRWRRLVLLRDPICVDPFGVHRERGEIVPATVADHVVPIAQGGARFDLENGQGLCASCHGRKTAGEDGGFGNRKARDR